MGYELEGSEQATRTYEDDELDSTAEVLAADRSITGEILASEIPKASTLMVATTKAAACFLRAFAPPTTELAAIRFDQDASRLCTIWQSEQRSDLIFAHLESRVPADRAAEWADELLRISNTERVLCLHSLQPLDCHRSAMLQMCSITTDDFAESLPPLPPPYTLADEPAAIITRVWLESISLPMLDALAVSDDKETSCSMCGMGVRQGYWTRSIGSMGTCSSSGHGS